MKETLGAFSRAWVPAKLRSGLKATYKRVAYFGVRYECPLCNSRLRTFLPSGLDLPVLREKKVVGGGYRMSSLCPVCHSIDRERLLYLFLLQKTDIFERPQSLLHIAPEPGVANRLGARAHLDYLTADISRGSAMLEMDITSIQLPDASFDAIICNHVLEHILDDARAMSELYRVLRPGGWAILQVPLSVTLQQTHEDASITTPTGREEAFGQWNHVRIYAADYRDRLARVGFEVTVFDWTTEVEHFGGRENSFGLNPEERVYVAVRPH